MVVIILSRLHGGIEGKVATHQAKGESARMLLSSNPRLDSVYRSLRRGQRSKQPVCDNQIEWKAFSDLKSNK